MELGTKTAETLNRDENYRECYRRSALPFKSVFCCLF